MAVKDRVTIELYVDDQGTVKIVNARKATEDLGQAGKKSGEQLSGSLENIGSQANRASSQLLGVLGISLSIAGAGYLIERGFSSWLNLISGGVSAVDDYRKSMIAGASMLTSLTETKFEPDLQKAYGQWRDYFAWLWTASIEADKKVAASQREIYEVAQELAKRNVVAINDYQVEVAGRLTDFMKSVSPMYGGERAQMQIRQEIRDLLAGQVRQNAQTAVQLKMIDENFSENIKKARQLGTVFEYLDSLLVGQKIATQDMAQTWDSVSASLQSVWQQLQIRAFGTAYDDVVRFGQEVMSTLIEDGRLTERGEKLADALGEAWERAKGKVEGLVDYIISDTPAAIRNVEDLASAVGTIAGAAATAIIMVSELIGWLKEGFGFWGDIADLAKKGVMSLWPGPKAPGLAAGKYLHWAQGESLGLEALPKPSYLSGLAPPTPRTRQGGGDTGGGGGGGGGAEGEARRLMTLFDTLQKDISRLSEGSFAEVDANLEKTLDQIYSRQQQRVVSESELEVMARQRAALQKGKIEEDFWNRMAKEGGDAFAQINRDYGEDLRKYNKVAGAKDAIDWARNKRIYDADYKQGQELLDLQKSSLDALAGSMPLLTQQLYLKGQALVLEIRAGRATLDHKLYEMELTDEARKRVGLQPLLTQGIKDNLLAQQALTEQAKKYNQYLEEAKAGQYGLGGYVQAYGMERGKTAQTRDYEAFKSLIEGSERWLGDTLGKGIVAGMLGKKTDFKQMGRNMMEGLVTEMTKRNLAHLFDAGTALGKQAFGKDGGDRGLDAAGRELTASGKLLSLSGLELGLSAGGLLLSGIGIMTNSQALVYAGMVLQVAGLAIQIYQALATTSQMTAAGALSLAAGELSMAAWLLMASSFSPFHSGGVVAHQGLIVAHQGWPMAADERLILAQTGEGVLPRSSMARLGRGAFESLRAGDFDFSRSGGGSKGGPPVIIENITHAPVYHYRPTQADMDRDARMIVKAINREAGRGIKLGRG